MIDLALPEERQKLGLDAVNKRGEQNDDFTWGEVHSFCTNLHKNGVSAIHEKGLTWADILTKSDMNR